MVSLLYLLWNSCFSWVTNLYICIAQLENIPIKSSIARVSSVKSSLGIFLHQGHINKVGSWGYPLVPEGYPQLLVLRFLKVIHRFLKVIFTRVGSIESHGTKKSWKRKYESWSCLYKLASSQNVSKFLLCLRSIQRSTGYLSFTLKIIQRRKEFSDQN